MMDSSSTYPSQKLERCFRKGYGDRAYNLYASNTQERHSQQRQNKLIASEQITMWAVMDVQGSVMANKYMEGYPGRHNCGGFNIFDVVEVQTIILAKRLFGSLFVNVHLSTCNRIFALLASGSIRVV